MTAIEAIDYWVNHNGCADTVQYCLTCTWIIVGLLLATFTIK